MVANLHRKRFVLFVIPFLLFACSPGDNTAKPQTFATPIASTNPSRAVNGALTLPNFTELVEKEGAAVVNVSTTQTVRNSIVPGLPQLSPDDPFYDFFRRFLPPAETQQFQARSLGSGFIISEDGYVLTNAHVVENADEVTVRMTNKQEYKAKVIGSDRRTDVALLKIDAKGLPKVALGDPAKLKVGEWVAAIGSPFGFENSVTAGIVSAKGRSLPNESYVPFIQTDVAVNPGNSGGPLFNLNGEVVGINSQIYSGTGGYMGVSFAIPIDIALNVSDQLRTNGKVKWGKLGVQIQDITPDLAQSFGLSNAFGALISSVDKGGPAAQAGLVAGDILLKYDGKPVKSSSELPLLVSASKPGSRVKIQIWRKGSLKELDIVVGEFAADKATEPTRAETAPNPDRLGLTLGELSAEQRADIGGNGGVAVINSAGKARQAGIRAGDVILAINNQNVADVDQFNNALSRNAGKLVAFLVRRGDSVVFIPIKISGE